MADTTVHEQYIPESTRENYLQLARDTSDREGMSAKGALLAMAKGWAENHKREPTAGWDHLAAWAKTADPTPTPGVDAFEFAVSRAVESARRDPTSTLGAHPDALNAAAAALKGEDGTPAASASVTQG